MQKLELILDHLKREGSITGLIAFEKYKYMHLPGGISKLKRRGHEIDSELVTEKNSNGTVRFTRYIYRGQKEEA